MLIEDADYEALLNKARAGEAAAPSKALLDMMAANPKTRRRVLEMVKEIRPDLSIPELDAAKPVLDEVTQTRAELAALKKELADERAEKDKTVREGAMTRTIAENRQRLREQGYQEEGIAAIEKLMTDRGLTDYEAAAALLDRTQPKDEMILPNYDRSWSGFTPEDSDEDHKLLVANKNSWRKWQDKQIHKFFDEKRRGVLRA